MDRKLKTYKGKAIQFIVNSEKGKELNIGEWKYRYDNRDSSGGYIRLYIDSKKNNRMDVSYTILPNGEMEWEHKIYTEGEEVYTDEDFWDALDVENKERMKKEEKERKGEEKGGEKKYEEMPSLTEIGKMIISLAFAIFMMYLVIKMMCNGG